MNDTALTKHDAAIVEREPTALEVISRAASDPAVNVDKLSALLAMKERLDVREAEMAFNRAMASIASKMPVIRKNGAIDFGGGKKAIKFAKFEDIDREVRPILSEAGLSISFSSKPMPQGVLMICRLSHVLGHSQSSEMQMPADQGPGRNGLQAIGSARQYAKRYLYCDMLNIVCEDQDDDGHKGGGTFINDAQIANIEDILAEISTKDTAEQIKAKFMKYMRVKSISDIYARDYKAAIEALEAKRREVAQ